MALGSNEYKNVHIVVPNAALMQRDAKDFRHYWSIGGLTNKVKYHDRLNFKHTSADLIIIDEADKLVLELPVKLRGYLNVSATICMTATMPKSKQANLE